MKFLSTIFMSIFFVNIAHAEEATSAGTAGGVANFGLLVILFIIFYILVIRPQSKKLSQHRDMVEALKSGDKVVTNGGIHGTVVEVNEDTIMVSVAEGVKIKFSKEAVAINSTADSAVTPEVTK